MSRPAPTQRSTDRAELLSKLARNETAASQASPEPPLDSLHRPAPTFMARLPVGFRPADRSRSQAEQTMSKRTVAARRRDLALSYGLDWGLAILLLVLFSIIDRQEGFRRQFSLTDTSLQHTYAVHERVPVWLLLVLAAAVPLVVIFVVGGLMRRSVVDVHNGVLGLLLAFSLTIVITDILKLLGGRPRPDIIDRCQPIAGAANAPVYGLATSDICTRTDLLKDGFRSWPSGHSSSSFAGLGFLSFYLAGKMRLWDQRGQSIKSWIAVTPLVGAAGIALSRTMDYRHHPTDVLSGSILGFFIGLWSYLLYYPSLWSENCYLPYEPRIPPTAYDEFGKRIPSRSSGYPPAPTELPLFHGSQSQQPSLDYDDHEQAAPRPSSHS